MSGLRYALRQIVNRPGFSVTVVLMLALGVGSTTAIFSMFYQILVEPLPVPAPEQLVNLSAPGPKAGSTSCSAAGSCAEQIFSYPMFRDLEAGQSVFAGLAAHRDFVANLSDDQLAMTADGIMVSGGYFRVLDLAPALGRLIGPQDEPRVDESTVVVLDYDYWLSRFGSDPNVLGRAITVNGQRLTVIGVTPQGFTGTVLGLRPQVYVPITLRWLMEPTRARDENDRRSYWVYLFARLLPGVSLDQASAGINGLYAGILNDVEAPINSAMPADVLEEFRGKGITLTPGARGQGLIAAAAERPLALLLGITALVLLIVCVNIASMLLARGVSRASEMAIRITIGATSRRLVSQLLVDTGVLALIGGAASLPVAAATLRVIGYVLPARLGEGLAVSLSPAALSFAAAATVSTVALFSLAPAIQALRSDPGGMVKGHTERALGGHGVARVRRGLATAQIAFSMVLLVLAGLFAQSLVNITRVDLGVSTDSVVTFTVAPRAIGHSPESTMATFDRIEERLAAEPTVISVGSARIALLANRGWGSRPIFEGFEERVSDVRIGTNAVSPGFFESVSMPLLLGRGFTDSDTLGSPLVAIVNERFVETFKLGDDALGTRFDRSAREQDIEIVGIVADAKYASVADDTPPQIFLPRRQNDNLDALTFYVRGSIDAAGLMRMVPRVISEVDRSLPVSGLRTLERQAQENVYLDRMIAILAAAFAVLATLLAAIGLHGVIAYNVAQRTRELGLRLALGATPRVIRKHVLQHVCRMGLLGGGLGIVAALGLGRLAESLLYGVTGYDPVTILAAIIVLGATVAAAGYLPARRASNVAPMEALRYE